MRKFKVGDRVRLVRLTTDKDLRGVPKAFWDIHMGKVGTIDEIRYDGVLSIRFFDNVIPFRWPVECFDAVKDKMDKPKKETPMNKTPKIEITKDNIWDIVDEEYKYIFVNASGKMYASSEKPMYKNFSIHVFNAPEMAGIISLSVKVTPWWTDWMTSLIERPKATRKFEVGDIVELRLENIYKGRVVCCARCGKSLIVKFPHNPGIQYFTEDGSLFDTEPVVLFHAES